MYPMQNPAFAGLLIGNIIGVAVPLCARSIQLKVLLGSPDLRIIHDSVPGFSSL